jgi:hypothetical protein
MVEMRGTHQAVRLARRPRERERRRDHGGAATPSSGRAAGACADERAGLCQHRYRRFDMPLVPGRVSAEAGRLLEAEMAGLLATIAARHEGARLRSG